jgi:biopolymer transport protein ExbB
LIVIATLLLTAAPAQAAEIGQPRSFYELFVWPGGGGMSLFIMLINVASIAVMIERFWTIRRQRLLPEGMRSKIRDLLANRQYVEVLKVTQADGSFLSYVVHATIQEGPHGFAAMEHAMAEAIEERTTRLLRRIEPLNILGNVGPMLGLMGTVLGIILAFQAIPTEGGAPKPAALGHSIGIALVATFWGLVVAIPALTAYAVLRTRIDAISAEVALVVQEWIGTLREMQRRARVAAAPAVNQTT